MKALTRISYGIFYGIMFYLLKICWALEHWFVTRAFTVIIVWKQFYRIVILYWKRFFKLNKCNSLDQQAAGRPNLLLEKLLFMSKDSISKFDLPIGKALSWHLFRQLFFGLHFFSDKLIKC